MKEVKTPKKPLAIYYAIVLLVLMLLNFVLVPWMSERQVKEVDYGTFMSMTEDKDIGRVDVESNQIIFTDKDEKQIYKTGLMNDPDLTQRLYDAGAQFSSEIVEQASPLMSFLLSFVLPIVLFVWLGNFMNKKLIEKAGGANSMMFGGVGKSNAKVYVQSTEGIHFSDVAGEDEAKAIVEKAVPVIDGYAELIAEGKPLEPKKISLADKLKSGIVNDAFYAMFVKADKFYATDKCISCGLCAVSCLTHNIELKNGKPIWSNRCVHCMKCICDCPEAAIEYGKASIGKPRYHCPDIGE